MRGFALFEEIISRFGPKTAIISFLFCEVQLLKGFPRFCALRHNMYVTSCLNTSKDGYNYTTRVHGCFYISRSLM
jgi:hypothetical protein